MGAEAGLDGELEGVVRATVIGEEADFGGSELTCCWAVVRDGSELTGERVYPGVVSFGSEGAEEATDVGSGVSVVVFVGIFGSSGVFFLFFSFFFFLLWV